MKSKDRPKAISKLEFHKRYNTIIIPLISQEKRSIITEIEKKKVS